MSVRNNLLLLFVASYCIVAGFPEGVSQADKTEAGHLGRLSLGSNMVLLPPRSGGHSMSQPSFFQGKGNRFQFSKEEVAKELKLCLIHCIAG